MSFCFFMSKTAEWMKNIYNSKAYASKQPIVFKFVFYVRESMFNLQVL